MFVSIVETGTAETERFLPTSVLNAINCLGAYALASLLHWIWTGLELGWSLEEGARALLRAAVAAVMGWALWRRKPWAWWGGIAAGAIGGFGLLALALGIGHAGTSGLTLGLVTAVFSALSALCLAAAGILLSRSDAREVFRSRH